MTFLPGRAGSAFLIADDGLVMCAILGKYPPAKPGALVCEPLKAAIRGR